MAKARVRDLDGVTRLVERNGRTGAEAERNLSAYLAERTAPSVEDLTPESRLSDLWEAYEAHLLEEGRAIRTMERYRYASRYVLKGLGGYTIREATTQRLDGFVKALKTNHGLSRRQVRPRHPQRHVRACRTVRGGGHPPCPGRGNNQDRIQAGALPYRR